MYAFGMGIKGAALATSISQIISAVICIVYLFRFRAMGNANNSDE